MEDRLADFTRDYRVLKLTAIAVVVGIISSFVARGLVWLIAVITNISFYQRYSSEFNSPAGNHLSYMVILVPMIGGLIVGIVARYGSDKIRGHGIPEALEAILVGRSRMEAKVAILKPLSSAIAIGTGGPFGAEGPIIMTGGAFGSLCAQLFHLSPAERKTLLVAGAAAGMSAIFSAPVAAVLLAVELLLFEWKPRSFIPVAAASAVAGALRIHLLGAGPIFPIPPHAPLNGEGLLIAAALGLLSGLTSGALTGLVYAFEDLFLKLRFHWMWWPVIGGLFVGIGGWIDPRVLGVGYDNIQMLLLGKIVGGAVITLLVIKALIWAIALGSGTSGGVLAPLLMMGGALGALVSRWIPVGDTGLWALLGMAAIMGGTMRSPLTSMIFAVELTRDFNLLPALLVSCVMAHLVTVLLLRRSILTEKVARRGLHITREYAIDPLSLLRVSDVMFSDYATIPSDMKVTELSDHIAKHDPVFTRHQAMLIVDTNHHLVGIVTRGDIIRALQLANASEITVIEAGKSDLIVCYPDEVLHEAAAKMMRRDIGRLPVVSREDDRTIVGYLGRASFMSARLRLFQEEQQQEPGWRQGFGLGQASGPPLSH